MTPLIAGSTYLMRRFSTCFTLLKNTSERSSSKVLQFVALLLSFPFFHLSHFCFKLAYALNQRRMRRICGEDFFLKFYDRRVANGSVIDVLQSLRHIERGIKNAESCYDFWNQGDLLSDRRLPIESERGKRSDSPCVIP